MKVSNLLGRLWEIQTNAGEFLEIAEQQNCM
jgi:hypothetical protein